MLQYLENEFHHDVAHLFFAADSCHDSKKINKGNSKAFEKAMISLLKNNYKVLMNKVILFKLFLFLSLEIFVFCFIDMSEDHSIGLRVPAINSTIGFIFSLGFLGYKFSKEIDKNFIYFLYSVLLMIPSGVFITYKINIHPWFDKNDFGHLILVLTMILFYRAIKSYSDIILKEN